MTAEAGAWGDLVVVPDHRSAERTICRATVGRDYKMVAGFKPSVIAAIDEPELSITSEHDPEFILVDAA